MFFRNRKGRKYHVLPDGKTEAFCGATIDTYNKALLAQGRSAPYLLSELPANAILCRHCHQSKFNTDSLHARNNTNFKHQNACAASRQDVEILAQIDIGTGNRTVAVGEDGCEPWGRFHKAGPSVLARNLE